MNHVHNHAALLDNTTQSMNHDHHIMNNPTETNTIANGHGGHIQDMMMMAMTFHGGFTEQILFDQWSTKTVGGFVASWFAVFFIAVFYEALKTLRDALAKRDICQTCMQTQNRQQTLIHSNDRENERSSDNDLISSVRIENHQRNRVALFSLPHLIQTLLHIIQITISYLLMLIAMTFNSYLLVAVVLGAGLGHFLFGWRRSSVVDYNEHCN